MRITIVGGGKVGSALARQLQAEGHEITVIDKNEQVVQHLGNTLDVIGCVGNGAAYSVLKSSGIETCDLLIAVTTTDEMNLLCCLSAHKLGAKRTIARVRDPEYAGQLFDLKDDLGLSMVINPERAVAEEIARILRFPAASQVEMFAKGKVELVSCRIEAGNPLAGLQLRDLQRTTDARVLICAVYRNGEVTIPAGDFVLNEGDELFLTGAPTEIVKTFRKTGLLTSRPRSVMIAGGGRITYYLTQALLSESMNVKIIEMNDVRANELAGLLPKASVICGDVADHELMGEESLNRQDAFIALTGLDEGNILSALYALREDVPKVIAKINNENLISLIKDSGLHSVITPKRIIADQVLCYVRALAARKTGGSVLSLYNLVEGHAEFLEFRADSNAKSLLDVPLMNLKMKKNTLIACLVRNGKVVIPGGNDCIMSGDNVMVATADQRLAELTDILEGEKV